MDRANRSRGSPARLGTGLAIATFALLSLSSAAQEHPLAERLRQGGLVIALATADQGPGPGVPHPPPACAEGTRLTVIGWQHALVVGTGLRKQGARVELVHAGPGCAARHTAYLAFGADRVRHDPDLAAACAAGDAGRTRRREALVARLATLPTPPDAHRAVVVDACNLRDLATPKWPACAAALRPGDALLFDPASGRPPRLVGCLAGEVLRAWSRLPEAPG